MMSPNHIECFPVDAPNRIVGIVCSQVGEFGYCKDELVDVNDYGDAERVASEKFSQRIGQNITQLESDPELESTSAVKMA